MAARFVGRERRRHALVERNLVRQVIKRLEVRLGRLALHEGCAHGRGHQVELIHGR